MGGGIFGVAPPYQYLSVSKLATVVVASTSAVYMLSAAGCGAAATPSKGKGIRHSGVIYRCRNEKKYARALRQG